ncbi:MAG: NAD(P)/FAD-dependent oxidoreductase, partial [Rhodanobacteraceae bacterium]
QQELAWFARLNAGLHVRLDDAGMRARLREHVELLRAVAGAIGEHALAACPSLDVTALRAMAGSRAMPELFAQAA